MTTLVIKYITPLVIMLFVACSGGTPFQIAYEGESEVGDGDYTTISIVELKRLYLGAPQRLISSMSIEGYVVANDRYGEFVNTIIVEDESGAIEVSLDMEDIYIEYPLDSRVRILCDDLWIASRGGDGGTLLLGGEPTGDYAVDMIPEEELAWRLSPQTGDSPLLPATVSIGEITALQTSSRVILEGLRLDSTTSILEFDSSSGGWISARHTFVDEQGLSIDLYVPSTISYYGLTLSAGSYTLLAIVDSYAGSFSLRLTGASINLW